MNVKRILIVGCCMMIGACGSPVVQQHVNVVTATINDTTWTATNILYMDLLPLSSSADSIEMLAFGNGDTLEFHGVADVHSPYPIVLPDDYIVLRRARGVFQIHSLGDAPMDTISCSRLSFGVIEGKVITGVALRNVNNVNDSAHIRCTFSLSSPAIP